MHDPASAAAEVFQRVPMPGQKAFHALTQEELHKSETAITEYRHEVMQFAQGFTDADQPMSAPVNLEAIARLEGQLQEGLLTHRPYRGDELLEDRPASGITMFSS